MLQTLFLLCWKKLFYFFLFIQNQKGNGRHKQPREQAVCCVPSFILFYFCCHHRLQLFLFVFSQNYDMILAARTDADLKGRSENIGV